MKYVVANSNSLINQSLKNHFNKDIFFFIESKQELNVELLRDLNPKFVFFPHWSYIIPEEIFNNFQCIVFHMTDLPFGRGGSPLQNLISRGITHTKISAIKVVKEIDAGPIYLKKELCLNGNAGEIFLRSSKIVTEMMEEIIETNPTPIEQRGDPVYFKRRNPEMSNIWNLQQLEQLYDYIRMLDAEGYPKAFIETEKFRFEFSRASLESNDSIIADVRIFKK
jgi:methionyl-tRNA formyltransferase